MENFSEFALENQDMVFGGGHTPTRYTTGSGTSGRDIYDEDVDTIVYFAPDSGIE